jgi:hypothetical protein
MGRCPVRREVKRPIRVRIRTVGDFVGSLGYCRYHSMLFGARSANVVTVVRQWFKRFLAPPKYTDGNGRLTTVLIRPRYDLRFSLVISRL